MPVQELSVIFRTRFRDELKKTGLYDAIDRVSGAKPGRALKTGRKSNKLIHGQNDLVEIFFLFLRNRARPHLHEFRASDIGRAQKQVRRIGTQI